MRQLELHPEYECWTKYGPLVPSCDNCAEPLTALFSMQTAIHGTSVHLCSPECRETLQRVWAPKAYYSTLPQFAGVKMVLYAAIMAVVVWLGK